MNEIEENVSIGPMTTLGIGGPARYYLNARSEDDVIRGLSFAASRGIGVFILGGGSNLLVSDRGINDLVIRIDLKGLRFEDGLGNTQVVIAGAGEVWDSVVHECIGRDLAGLECMSGIPGMVGGTPVQNVGAYGQEVSETIISVRCLDRSTGSIVELTNEECVFSYRSSIFNTTKRERYIVFGVKYSLKPGGKPKIVYKDLIDLFRDRSPSLHEVREGVLKVRRAKSMVIDPADPNCRTAGSFFKNPVIEVAAFTQLRSDFPEMPSFPFGELVKVPAAWLIENAGFYKGFVLGRAGLSTRHSLALINLGGATAAELIALKEMIQHAVRKKFGILLVPEPVFAGF